MTRPPVSRVQVIQITEAELKTMLAEVAEAGAERALSKVGLSDAEAGRDVRDLRDLMSVWREAKREAGRTAVRILVTGLLALIAAAVWLYLSTQRPH